MLFTDIVVGVDGSEAGYEACRQAARLVRAEGHVEFVCVIDVAETVHAGFSATRIADELAAGGTAALDAAVGLFPGRSSRGTPRRGAVPELLAALESSGATLLVVGSHGHRRAEEILLGGVAGELLHAAPCSVLVARARRRPGSSGASSSASTARRIRSARSRSPRTFCALSRAAEGDDGAAREGVRSGRIRGRAPSPMRSTSDRLRRWSRRARVPTWSLSAVAASRGCPPWEASRSASRIAPAARCSSSGRTTSGDHRSRSRSPEPAVVAAALATDRVADLRLLRRRPVSRRTGRTGRVGPAGRPTCGSLRRSCSTRWSRCCSLRRRSPFAIGDRSRERRSRRSSF